MTVWLKGSIPANVLPFDAELRIDEAQYRRHLEWLVRAGVGGVTTNGHAGEVSVLSREEWRRALAIALETVAGRVPVLTGVYAESHVQAAALAREAEREGADALLVLPPNAMLFDAPQEVALQRFAAIGEAVATRLVAFVYPAWSRMQLSTETLVRACEQANVVAVKEWSLDIATYERNLRAMRSLGRPISVLSSFSTNLLPSLAVGADGILSGHGSVIADLQADLLCLVDAGDLAAAQQLYERIQVLTRVVYRRPLANMYARMKEQLVMLGRLDSAHVRPPLTSLAAGEREELRRSLVDVCLLQAAHAG
jgi:4-hydroxy-tetrahydrodipicolinate synthase